MPFNAPAKPKKSRNGDRALIATLVYTFGRVGAVVKMNVEDYYPNVKRWFVRLHEKGGKHHEMRQWSCHWSVFACPSRNGSLSKPASSSIST